MTRIVKVGRFDDLTGRTFGRLTVVSRGIEYIDAVGSKRFKWKCLCECGNTIYVRPDHLKRGAVLSCGCLHKETAKARGLANIKHSGARRTASYNETRLYKIWAGMKQRCQSPANSSYPNYGGRGIKVTKEWEQFIPFQKWAMSHGYNNNLSIDRVDCNGNYEPENCRWADKQTQANNTRSNRYIEVNGVAHTLAEWSRISGIKAGTISRRIKRGIEPQIAIFSKEGVKQ